MLGPVFASHAEGDIMNLAYAVDRLYQVGWENSEENQAETLPDGRKFPSVAAVQREFAQAGLELTIKHNPSFKCFRATWSGGGEQRGTVIGACEREAAVYALAQLLAAHAKSEL